MKNKKKLYYVSIIQNITKNMVTFVTTKLFTESVFSFMINISSPIYDNLKFFDSSFHFQNQFYKEVIF
jgi:hypothetical protein